MAKTDRVVALPEWFSLDKYHGTKGFGAAEWFTALAVRQDIYRTVERRNGGGENAYDYQCLVPHLEVLRRQPLDAESGRSYWEHIPYGDEIAKLAPVRHLEINHLAWQAYLERGDAGDGDCDRQQADRWQVIGDDGLFEAGSIVLPPMPIFIDYRGSGAPAAAVFVDLGAQDSVLLEAFALWLKSARAEQPPSKRERPAYMDWTRYGLLPYLDLLIWSMETSNQISHHVMAQAVGYRNGGDSFRKTVPKLAADLMRSNLSELETLAAIEAAPEKHKT
nr:DUF6387 family protein [Pseudomonas sp. s4]